MPQHAKAATPHCKESRRNRPGNGSRPETGGHSRAAAGTGLPGIRSPCAASRGRTPPPPRPDGKDAACRTTTSRPWDARRSAGCGRSPPRSPQHSPPRPSRSRPPSAPSYGRSLRTVAGTRIGHRSENPWQTSPEEAPHPPERVPPRYPNRKEDGNGPCRRPVAENSIQDLFGNPSCLSF